MTMPETIAVTFQYALGQRVAWAGDAAAGPWRVLARLYEERADRRWVRYQVRRLNETEDAISFEEDLWPLEDA
jgi:hypothetical protein